MGKIKVAYFNIPKESLDNIILSWWVSRTEDKTVDLVKKLKTLNQAEKDKWLGDILSQDLPIREMVPITYIVEDGPRSFWDQLDRSRVGHVFWEQSLRVKDLENNFEYFVPDGLYATKESLAEYKKLMSTSKETYKRLTNIYRWPREMARGVIPLHIITRGTVGCNLRSLINLLATRNCYFAQSGYWENVANELIDNIWKNIPSLKNRNLLKLPCTTSGKCQFEKDLYDRVQDFSNPLCPIMLDMISDKTVTEKYIGIMVGRYPNYIADSKTYANRVGLKLSSVWDK